MGTRHQYCLLCILTLVICAAGSAQPVKPLLRLETGMHSARGNSLSADARGRYLLSCSDDKTARFWDALTGTLIHTLRVPTGDADEGKLYACALDPDTRVAAVGGHTGQWEGEDCIYILNPFTGEIIKRLCGLPNVITSIEFSKDGQWLAAGFGSGGVIIYNTNDWQINGFDKDYNNQVKGLNFDHHGNLLTACSDGYVRLYKAPAFLLAGRTNALTGSDPFSVAFNASGNQFAVGYNDNPAVDVFNTTGLKHTYSADNTGIPSDQDISCVQFSSDGNTLYAGGSFTREDAEGNKRYVLRKWQNAGKGRYQDIPFLSNSVIGIKPLPEGRMAILSTHPDLAVVNPAGDLQWEKKSDNQDFAVNDPADLMVSPDEDAVTVKSLQGNSLFFRLSRRSQYDDNALGYPPVTESRSLKLTEWRNTKMPEMNNTPILFLNDKEICRSACIGTDGKRVAWGGDYNLYLTDQSGKLVWKTALPEVAFALNIAGKGKVITVALGDGTIRWYNVSKGKELLALFITKDRQRWVLFTPNGYYDASPGAEDLLGWHLNNGPDKAPSFYPASRFRQIYYRPDIIDGITQSWDDDQTVSTLLGKGTNKEQTITDEKLPPTITITHPNSGSYVTGDLVSITYNIKSPANAPASNVKVLVNGRPASVVRGAKIPDNNSTTIQVSIPRKDCMVTLIAENSNGASPDADLLIKYDQARQTTGNAEKKARLFVLAIGVSDYNIPSYKLNYAADDAKGFVSFFNKQKGLMYEDVLTKFLTDKEATKLKIQVELEWIQRQTTDKDVAMIFFAGHGINDNNGYFYMGPVEADAEQLRVTCLNFSELTQTVGAIRGKVVVFIDACHSGNVTGRNGSFGDISGAVSTLGNSQNGAVVFTSSTGRELSEEHPDWKHGAFTKALLEGLSGEAASKKGKDKISFKSLDLFISQRVEELTNGRQHPTSVVPPNIPDFDLAVPIEN